MTKTKKPSTKSGNLVSNENLDPKTKGPKKNYMVDDEDEDESLDLDDKDIDDDDDDLLDSDPDEKDITIPKTFDPFDDDDDDDDDDF